MMPYDCESTTSCRKSIQKYNLTKSYCTNCSSTSSNFFKYKKPTNSSPMRAKNFTPVKQRVMSATMLKIKQLQSQLSDANYHLSEVARENQTLKTLQKRQDAVLSKYESTNADFPRLIHSHEEEVRALTEGSKKLKITVRTLTAQLKQKENELKKVKGQLVHLEKLDRDKHLIEREKLGEMLNDYKMKLGKCEEQVIILNRKLILESKIFKQRLNIEIAKHRQTQKELVSALEEINLLNHLLEAKCNTVRPRNPRFVKLARDYLPINVWKSVKTRNYRHDNLHSQSPVTKVHIQPLFNGSANKRESDVLRRSSEKGLATETSVITAPIQNIRQRLSSESVSNSFPLRENSGVLPNNYPDDLKRHEISGSKCIKTRPNSSVRLEKLVHLDENGRRRQDDLEHDAAELATQIKDPVFVEPDTIDKKDVMMTSNSQKDEEFESLKDFTRFEQTLKDKRLRISDNYLEDVITGNKQNIEKELVNNFTFLKSRSSSLESTESDESSEKVDKPLDSDLVLNEGNLGIHRESASFKSDDTSPDLPLYQGSLELLMHNDEKLSTALQELELRESKLIKTFFNMDNHINIVNGVLADAHKIDNEREEPLYLPDKKSSLKNINLDKKTKLLATLRAIDNGDSMDSIEESKQNNVRETIFNGTITQ
ncbi:lebercilin-like protein [Euwallacea fornicatus]|uniref:lebercilin-like protein n=1 Tax=Euwallacea fornicatus TaxID=995702 RepID=UPI00338F87D4